MTWTFLEQSYNEYPRIEEAFEEALDESLHPRGPDLLYDLVGELGMPAGARVLDLGCGEGGHAVRLATRFGFAVQGVDPVPRNIDVASAARDEAATRAPELARLVRFGLGSAEAVPAGDASVDLIWCREVLYHIASLDAAFAECRRVLRPGGRMLIYHNFATERLAPREAEFALGGLPASADPLGTEAAVRSAGLEIEQCLVLDSEFGEYAEESAGRASRKLLHAARLLRAPERYIATFGQANYDIMLGDCFWHVYRMIGKLSSRIYVLRAP